MLASFGTLKGEAFDVMVPDRGRDKSRDQRPVLPVHTQHKVIDAARLVAHKSDRMDQIASGFEQCDRDMESIQFQLVLARTPCTVSELNIGLQYEASSSGR
ncbi:hypothetical protein PHIN9_16690 [Polynucleobacter sp. HIN9]|nr:hypothetical protein PHIN9_16690 [Polynucleobacter sp. HIN9]